MTRYIHWILPLFSVVFLLVFGYFFLPLNDLGDTFGEVNYFALIPAVAVYFLSIYFRAVRWRFLLKPVVGVTVRPIFPVIVVGRMAGNVLPGKFSGIVRAWYLGVREDVSAASALGTVVAERFLDAIALYVLIVLVWLLPGGLLSDLTEHAPGGESLFVVLSLVPVIFLGLALGMVMIAPIRIYAIVVARIFFFVPVGLRIRLVGIAERLAVGLTVIRSPRVFAQVFVLSLPVWLAEVVAMGTIGIGFNLDDSFGGWIEFTSAMILFTAVVNLALIAPSIGGLSGTFTFFGAAALVALGVPEAKSGAFTLTAHAIVLFPITLLGLAFVARDQISLRTLLFRRGERRDTMT